MEVGKEEEDYEKIDFLMHCSREEYDGYIEEVRSCIGEQVSGIDIENGSSFRGKTRKIRKNYTKEDWRFLDEIDTLSVDEKGKLIPHIKPIFLERLRVEIGEDFPNEK